MLEINLNTRTLINGQHVKKNESPVNKILVSSQGDTLTPNTTPQVSEDILKQQLNISTPQILTDDEIFALVKFHTNQEFFEMLDRSNLIKDYFDAEIRPHIGIPDFENTPGLSSSVKDLLNVCKDKTVVMFGEQHELQMVYFFQKNILPTLIKSGFNTVVLEALPFDFNTPKYDQERAALYKTGKVSPKETPLIFDALMHSKDFYSFKLFVEACAQNNLKLYGANPTEEVVMSVKNMNGADFITDRLREQVEKIPTDTKTIFYTGALHNNYEDHYHNGIREEVNQKFGQENVISVDITDIDQMIPEYFFEQYEILEKANVEQFPAAIPVDNNINEDYLLVLRKPNKSLKQVAEEMAAAFSDPVFPITFEEAKTKQISKNIPKAKLETLDNLISFVKSQGYSVTPMINIKSKHIKYEIKLNGKRVGEMYIGVSHGVITCIDKSAGNLVEYLQSKDNIENNFY